jgi:hypothetical protein
LSAAERGRQGPENKDDDWQQFGFFCHGCLCSGLGCHPATRFWNDLFIPGQRVPSLRVVIRVGLGQGLRGWNSVGHGPGFGRRMQQVVPFLDFERPVASRAKGEAA